MREKPFRRAAGYAAAAACVLFSACQPGRAEGGEKADGLQACLPLFRRNSIAGKVLDVAYSANAEIYRDGNVSSNRLDAHLLFDTRTGRYRAETKRDAIINIPPEIQEQLGTLILDKDVAIDTWDGKEHVEWHPNCHSLERGGMEYRSGSARVSDESVTFSLSFMRYFGERTSDDEEGRCFCPWDTYISSAKDPTIGHVDGDTVAVETTYYKFEFSKKTGVFKRCTHYHFVWDEEAKQARMGEKYVSEIHDFSNHVERNGVWLPLTVVNTSPVRKANVWFADGEVKEVSLGHRIEYSVDPGTLRLLDEAEAPSVFSVELPEGCHVTDEIRKEVYRVGAAGQTLRGLPKAEALTEGAEPGVWTMDFEAAKRLAAEKSLPILLGFAGSDWSPLSHQMDRAVFYTRAWKDFARQRLVMVLIDFPRDERRVPKAFAERNVRLGEKYDVTAIHLPTYILLASDGERVLGKAKAANGTRADDFIREVAEVLKKL